jgi:YbbR domain-containing protein
MGLPEPEEETVLVIGPQERVDTVSQVVASLDVSGRSALVEQAVRLEPRDQRGFLVQGVTVEPSVIGVMINIEPTLFSRTVVIVAEVQGAPLDGYNLVAVTVSPSTVTIFGLPSLIQETAVVQTEVVDISGASSSLMRRVSLELPAGASVSEDVSVIVTVRVEAASGQLVFLVPVVAAGLGEGLSLVGELPSVEVTLSGPLPTLFVVSPADIVVILELSGLEAGEHTVEVVVTAPAGLAVDSVSLEDLQVQLEEQ